MAARRQSVQRQAAGDRIHRVADQAAAAFDDRADLAEQAGIAVQLGEPVAGMLQQRDLVGGDERALDPLFALIHHGTNAIGCDVERQVDPVEHGLAESHELGPDRKQPIDERVAGAHADEQHGGRRP